jgi:hypothetical protein
VALFLLGAGFMLVETKAVVHLALVFGSTWVVNTAVFSALLLLILCANLYVIRRRPERLRWHFAGLFVTLGLNLAVPLDLFLGLPQIVQGLGAGALVMLPVFFSGVVFATLLRGESQPEQALAYNTAGAILGGVLETTSLLIGFQHLVAVTGLIYLAAFGATRRAQKSMSESVAQIVQG